MQSEINLEHICLAARMVVKKAVLFIKTEAAKFDPSKVEMKGFNDLVSYVDKGAEQICVDGLRSLIPGCGFITEENTAGSENEKYKWIIDPLDGTTNFVHGVPCYCVSIALMYETELVLGIVHEVNMNECFYSWKNAPAYLNEKIISVSKKNTLSDALIGTGFPYTNFERWNEYLKVFEYCMRNTHGIRRPGSAAADLAYVACGRYDAFFEYGLNSYDVAAGAFLVQQAGGRVDDFKGTGNFVFGREIIAGNAEIFAEFYEIVSTSMNNN